MFFFKKIFSPFFFPLPLCLELLLIGIILLRFTRRRRLGKGLVASGLVLLILLSNGAVSAALLRPLERRYTPVYPGRGRDTALKYIAVLRRGHSAGTKIPPSIPL